MKFGQHQSFYLRVNWIARVLKMIKFDNLHERFFYDELAFERIGLGKNMLKSLKFWSISTNLLKEDKNSDNKPIHIVTNFGELVFKYDRFIRSPLTTSLIHYYLASNKEQATTWYWFFNIYQYNTSSNYELLQSLIKWTQENCNKPVSENTLRRDIDCLKQIYTMGSEYVSDPEDIVASPLSKLKLIYESKGNVIKRTPGLSEVSIEALYFVLLVYLEINNVDNLTVEEIKTAPLLWGKIFNLSSQDILEAVEIMQRNPSYALTLNKTNQLHTINIKTRDPISFLEEVYARKVVF
ncbi:DUF4007 family protein [Paenibacillus urinalis]|uniref:DUF4007 family protein n=1 Tax=Paenibacillus urinalis TaxID=521520 RepID=UPI0019616CCC